MRILAGALIFVFGLGQMGCQVLPTQIFEKKELRYKNGYQIPAGAIVIDVRPPFEYSLSHLNGAISMQWEDFSQRTEPYLGLLEKDLFFHARRLARHGITLDSKIIIVGKGLLGRGEEGRLAWTFKVMGIKDVSFTSIDSFNMTLTKEAAPPVESKPIWKPIVEESLMLSKRELIQSLAKRTGQPADLVIIDVRTESEYLGKTASYYSKNAPDLSAINIPWVEFLTDRGEANTLIRQRLIEVGITEDRQIVLIDEKGVRSAAVTLALLELGYAKATNFAGGYMELLGQR